MESCELRRERRELAAHLQELHPHIKIGRRARIDLARDHAREHWRRVTDHHHGPNPGPDDRPPGWRTGSDVVMKERS